MTLLYYEPLISEACYLTQRCVVSLAPNEPSECPRRLIKEEPQRPHSALHGLVGAISEPPKPARHTSALTGLLRGNN